jgi:transposase
MAPTELLRSASGYKKKTDKKDCSYIYETMRGHVLADNRLHGIWVPDKGLREDREVVRARFDVGQKLARVKTQIHTLLKKFGVQKPEDLNNWTKAFRAWLEETGESMGPGFRIGLETLLRQLDFLEGEQAHLRRMILELSQTERYRDQSERLQKIVGVGLITAMTFLTEMGDMTRFSNRRQVGSFMGLVPSSYESGEVTDRKGRITRDGPYRIRCVLNQALWMHLKYNGEEKAVYERIVARNPKRKKKAVVACMRRLGIRMWHIANDVESSKKLRLAA